MAASARWCLTAWKLTDGHAELLALAARSSTVMSSMRWPARRGCAAVPSAPRSKASSTPAASSVTTAPAPRLTVTGRPRRDRPPSRPPRRVTLGRRRAGAARRHDAAAGGRRRAAHGTSGPPRSAVMVDARSRSVRRRRERHGRRPRLHERLGQRGVARPPRDEHEVELVEAEPAVAPRARARRARPSRPARPHRCGRGRSAPSPRRRGRRRAGTPWSRRSRTASRNASWSSVKAKRVISAAGRARARRPCCAGSRSCRRRSGPTARTA